MPAAHPVSQFGARSLLVAATLLASLASSTDASAQAETVLQNVRFGSDGMSYEAPRLIVRGSPLSEDEIRRLLDPASTVPAAERVSKLEAAEVLAPELIATVKFGSVDQRTTYRDVSAKRISGGRIASVTSTLGAMEGTQEGRKVTGSNGAISVQDIDLGVAVAMMSAKAGPDEPLKRVYGGFSMEALRIIDSLGLTTEIGAIRGAEFSARPTALGWTGTFGALSALDKDKKSPGATGPAMDALADLFESFSAGAAEASDIRVKGRVEKDDTDLAISMKRIAYTPASAGRGAEFRVDGSEFVVGDSRVAYGTLAFGGLAAKPAIDALREISLNPDNPSPNVLRRMLTAISSIRMENIETDLPQDDAAGSAKPGAERMKASVGRFEIVAEKPINGIPSDMRIVMRNLAFPLPQNSDEESVATLKQLGYDRIEGSMGMSLAWNEGGQEILVRDFSIDGKDMGSATLRGIIGGLGRDVFDEDVAVASVALASAVAKSLELTVDNRGLFERIVAREARRQKRPPEDVRREYGLAASVGIPAILGNNPSSKTLAMAVARFVAKPGKLTVQARAKRPSGFGFADYMANPTPAGVLQAIDVTASAE